MATSTSGPHMAEQRKGPARAATADEQRLLDNWLTIQGINLTRQADGHALLKIVVPQVPVGGVDIASPSSQFPSADQIAMLKPMLAGAHLAIAVEPTGRLVHTSSPYVTGQRVTLVDVDVDSLLSDDTLLQRLQAARTRDETKAILKNVPGLKINLDPEITIEFE